MAGRLVEPRRWCEAACRAVSDAHLGFPGQTVAAAGQIAHVGVWAIARAARNRDEPAMSELVNVVLDSPVVARLAYEVWAHLGGDDLVGHRAALGDYGAVE